MNKDRLEYKLKLLQQYLTEEGYTFNNYSNILAAGCGDSGLEAFMLRDIFLGHCVGIDLDIDESVQVKNPGISLVKGDLCAIPFPDNNFDFIHCYHVLEHVSKPTEVLKELKRVLSSDGILFIGFPNRLRITPMYFSQHQYSSIIKAIKANLRDYKLKINGKFYNHHGAHAGFSEKEFIDMAKVHYTEILCIRKMYNNMLYPKFKFISHLVWFLSLDDLFYPSNYYLLKKS